jgi:hypothetical protein
VVSKAPPPANDAISTRNWYEIRLEVKANPQGELLTVLPDTGAAITLADRSFIKENFKDAKWEMLERPVRYAGAGPGTMHATQAAYIALYIPSWLDTRQVLTLWRMRVYIIPDLKPNILIGMDNLVPQKVVIDVQQKTIKQRMCGDVKAAFVIKPKDKDALKIRKVVAKAETVVMPQTERAIEIHHQELSAECDYVFEPQAIQLFPARVYATAIDHKVGAVRVRNDSDKPIRIQARARLGRAIPMDVQNIYHLDATDYPLAAAPDLRTFVEKEAKTIQGVTVYGNAQRRSQLTETVESFPDIWVDRGRTARIPQEYWMPIELKDGWQQATTLSEIH